MDKGIEEEDFRGLDEEIDDAVDRLFIENKNQRSAGESFSAEPLIPETSLKPRESAIKPSMLEPALESLPLEPSLESPILQSFTKPSAPEASIKPSFLEPSYELEFEKNVDPETAPQVPSTPVEFSKSIESMETQLLSLEWEITEEKLKKTKEEVLALRECFKQRPEISSVLSGMEKVLNQMLDNDEDIRPERIKILLDSKETIKLLAREETEGEINIYKQLAYLGIESRFSSLEGPKESKIVQPYVGKVERPERAELSPLGEKKIEDMSNKMNLFMVNVEELFRTLKQQISSLEEATRKPPSPPVQVRSQLLCATEVRTNPLNITIIRVNKKLFGVESEAVFKLFKAPNTFQERHSNKEKIRLRDFEMKLVDLKKILAIPGGNPGGEIRILAVKDSGGYKGFLVDQVVKKVSAPSEKVEEIGEYFSAIIHSTYQEQSEEVPILNLKKF